MTTDELKQEAEEFIKRNFVDFTVSEKDRFFLMRTYIASAEPREKRIAELEDKLDQERETRGCIETDLNTRIAELEQENAELRKLKRECETSLCRAEYQYNYEQLTKAKELLKMVLDWQCRCGNGYPTWQEVCAKTEQFLNSEVEK